MHRNHKIQFRPEPEFAETTNKNPAGTGIFYEPQTMSGGGGGKGGEVGGGASEGEVGGQVKGRSYGSARTQFAVV